MNIALEKKDDLSAIIKVHLESEDYSENVNKVVRDYAKKANIKGFRKGMVPPSVIKRMYGKGIVFEELNKVLSQALERYINDENLPLVGEPLPMTRDLDFDAEAMGPLDFDYEVGLSPTFSLSFKLKSAPKIYNVLIDTEILNEEIENVRSRYGEMTNPEVSVEGDTLFGKLMEVDGDGNPVNDGHDKMFAMNPDRIVSDSLKKDMGGKKEGDTITGIKMTDLFKEDSDVRWFWERNVSGEVVNDVNDETLAHLMAASFIFEVRKVNHVTKAELNEELFEKVFASGDVSTEEEFRSRLESDMENFFKQEARKYYEGKMMKSLIEENEVPLPEAFLRRFLMASREKIDESNVDQYLEEFLRNTRWELIIKKMMEMNPSLQLTNEAVHARARQVVEEQYKPMLPNSTDEQLEHFALQLVSDEKTFNRLANEVLAKNIFEYIRSEAQPEEEDITASEFLKLK